MKKIIILFFTTIMLSSCASFHSGYIAGTAPPVENNFKYVGNVLGSSQATYVFGIGGLLRDGLVREAKNNLIQNTALQDGQTLVNYTVDHKKSYYLAIVWTHKVVVTADILQYQQ